MKNPNSMLSTSCRMVATKMMKRKNSCWLQVNNMSILFLNQYDKNHLHVLRIVVLVFVNLILRMSSCVDTSCSCCIFSVQPVTSLLCFFAVLSVIYRSIYTLRVQHELPRVFVSASFASCRNVRMALICDFVVGNTCVLIPSNFYL